MRNPALELVLRRKKPSGNALVRELVRKRSHGSVFNLLLKHFEENWVEPICNMFFQIIILLGYYLTAVGLN